MTYDTLLPFDLLAVTTRVATIKGGKEMGVLPENHIRA